ncbi:rhodanese-like domain-containing protein [Microbacterium sp.]|uniref:rhodanese-like domain-containing protein n=1 Tax=Microbacterium sp. TaxID=51671 RepID=UPI0028AA371C|nr:rhodanese-like domain-containing protein [Microbacterium sp.]
MMDGQDFFAAKLQYETDASDVYAAQKAGTALVVVDVRSDEAWAQGRVPGAIHMHYSEIADRALEEISSDASVVVYCWSPGCNAGAKGALEFAKLGYQVREMIGGFEYWVREGYPVEDHDGIHRRPIDPLTGVPSVRTRP